MRRAVLLSEQLLDDPRSRYRAEKLGSLELLGWDMDRVIAADTRDAIFAIALGLSGKKPVEGDYVKRPAVAVPEDVPQTIADFDVAAFMRKLAT